MLKCETNTPQMAGCILSAAAKRFPCAGPYDVIFEHGQWWLICGRIGICYSVNDAEGGDSVDGFDFEEV